MTKNMGLLLVLLGIFLVGVFYYAIYWFSKNPNWQDKNVIYARKVLGKGFKVALNGLDWNRNKIPECIAFMPVKKLQKIAPHLQAVNKIAVIENDSILFFWHSRDSVAFIPLVNSLQKNEIPIVFSNQLDSINSNQIFYLKFYHQFQITN